MDTCVTITVMTLTGLYQAIKGTTSSHLRKKKVVCYVMLLEVGDKLIGSLNTRKGNRNSGRRLCIMVCPSFWEGYYMLIYTHCWELMNSVGSHGSSSLLFMMKVMVCHFVSDSHEVMTALIVVLPIIVVVEISLQLHQASM